MRKAMMRAIETGGTVDERCRLLPDEALSDDCPNRVRVIVLLPEEASDIDETEWLRAAASNPAFDFLKEAYQDAYTVADGSPFNDQNAQT